MRIGARPAAGLIVTLTLAFASAPGFAQRRSELPLVRVEAPRRNPRTDDSSALRRRRLGAVPAQLGELAAAHGSPVLGLKMRSYLSQRRTPDEMAAALAPVVRGQLGDWGRSELMVVGYSRGADIAPFVVNRWPEDLRSQISGIALVGLSERAGFEFHYDDLLFDIARPTDIPTRPEVEKLVGMPMWCLRGADENESFCDRPVAGMQVATHPGSHRAGRDDGTAQLVLHELGLDR